MRKQFLSIFIMLCSVAVFAQELTVKETLINPSNKINDGQVELEVTGGTPPYTYKWSSQETSLKSNTAINLTEGVDYSVLVKDATGKSVEKTFNIDTESITEIFNGTMTPAVAGLGSVLFWDPFAATGIYDPVVYADVKLISIPEWNADTEGKFSLQQWLKPEGSHVNKGDKIAVISKSTGGTVDAFAQANGELKYLVKEGGVIYNSDNKKHVIEQGAQYLAEIKYDEPIPLVHPNGDPQTKNIPFIVVWLLLGATFFTLRMGFINIRGFRHSLDLAKGKYDDPDAPGQVTHFQALATAVSGTVGLGNIAGVAVAVSLGGAGATMWMILAGLLGMSSKFVECTLGVKYRDILPDGRVLCYFSSRSFFWRR